MLLRWPALHAQSTPSPCQAESVHVVSHPAAHAVPPCFEKPPASVHGTAQDLRIMVVAAEVLKSSQQ